MTSLTRTDIKALLGASAPPAISLFLPTERAGVDTLQNPNRLKRLLGLAEQRLATYGFRSSQEELLRPAFDLLGDYPFWQHCEDGLALFASEGFFQLYSLPYRVSEACFVGESFHIKPLLPLLVGDGEFYILALSKKSVELHLASRHSSRQIELKNVPQSQDDALRLDDPQEILQSYSVGPGGRGEAGAIFHGYGGIKEDAKNRALRYFQIVDRGLHGVLKESRAPLVLAGVEYYLPIYRDANTYAHLVDQIVPGSADGAPIDDLRAAAWSIVQPLFAKARQQAAEAIEAGLAKGQAAIQLEEAVAAARHGRAHACFAALHEFRWGAFAEESATIEELPPDHPRARDLIDFAAAQTVLHGGDAFPVNTAEEAPGRSPLAVLFRY
jgi:hypothetical protein